MYRIENLTTTGVPRVVAPDVLTQADFVRIATELRLTPFRARKCGYVAARQSLRAQRIETRWNQQETINTAEPGDWIAVNMSQDGHFLRDADGNLNIYVIKEYRFPILYSRTGGENEHGALYYPHGGVEAIFLSGGFEILAPWGEVQRANAGYLVDNGSEIYGNAKETFDQTYRRE